MILALEAAFVMTSLGVGKIPAKQYRIADISPVRCSFAFGSAYRLTSTTNMIEVIKGDFELLPAVSNAMVTVMGNRVNAQIFLKSFDRKSRYSVYEKLDALYDGFPEIDFNVKVIDHSGGHAIAI